MTRGFFEIGVFHNKTATNLGTLMRSAFQLGASGVFTIGRRYQRQSSDTTKSYRHLPVRHFLTFDEYVAALPMDTPIVAVEFGGKPVEEFTHPERASYLLGAEDSGLPHDVIKRCPRHLSLRAVGQPSYNVAVAGSIVMYQRRVQLGWGPS